MANCLYCYLALDFKTSVYLFIHLFIYLSGVIFINIFDFTLHRYTRITRIIIFLFASLDRKIKLKITSTLLYISDDSDSDTGDKTRPYFEEPLHSISVSLGQDAVFKCIAKGNPMPAFKWYTVYVIH